MSPAHFGFTKLVVTDLEAAATFYKSVAGLTELVRIDEEIAGQKISEILFKPNYEGAATYALLKFHGPAATGAGDVILGFVTDNVDAFLERAVTAGGTLVDPARDMPHHGVRVGFVKDHEGHLLEVVQMLG
ncbi:VOC family protein [Xanthobacter wiegelii]|uniref:VOC family protein n=1 Tax=Xanthobacter wiegelii TaxID=3119913 RepID=UPI003726E8A6